jgi:HD-like signal output (HDOD) protein
MLAARLDSLDCRPSPVAIATTLSAVPSAPHIVSRLAGLLHHGSPTLGEVARLVRLDPGLAMRLLTAAYQYSDLIDGPCYTIEDAINRIGHAEFRQLVKDGMSEQVIDWPLCVYNLDTAELWRWSVAGALSAELLAERVGEDADIAYTLGLLHRVGMFAVEEWARHNASWMVIAGRSFPREYTAGEAALLGYTHAEVGAALLSSRNFPLTLSEPIRFQYVPACRGPYSRLACLLHAAKWLCAAVCSDETDRTPALPENRFLDALHLTSYELIRFVVEVRIRLGAVRNAVALRAA